MPSFKTVFALARDPQKCAMTELSTRELVTTLKTFYLQAGIEINSSLIRLLDPLYP